MRKIISVLLSVILLVTLAVPAMAATVTQEITSTAIEAGESVTVTVSLDEAVEDVTVYQYSLYYNKDLFTMTGSEGSATVSNPLSDSDGDYFMISYVDPASSGVTIEAGTLAALTFEAREDLTQEQAASFLLRQDYFWDTSYEDIEGISLANGTVSITVAPAAAATYTVTLTEGEGYTIAATEGSTSPVTEGGSFSFTVTVLEGYEGTPLVDANGGEIPLLNGVYTIEDITEDQVVTVAGITKIPVVQTYTITLTEGTGYAIAPVSGSTSPVEAGGSYSFTVSVLDGYVGDPVVKINGSTLGQTNGVYTISNVNTDYTVTVSGISAADTPVDQVIFKKGSSDSYWPNPSFPVFLDSLTIKGLAVTGYEWDSANEVCTVTLYKTTAKDASFTLTAQVGYASNPQMMSSYSLTIDGNRYNIPSNGNISIAKALTDGQAEVVVVGTANNVSATKTIRLVVDGSTPPAPATYTVTLTEGTGYTIAAAEGSVSPVTEGGSFSFTVTVNEGYEGTPVVKANDTELSAENGVYTIENITADQNVTVAGITVIPNTYTVTLTEGTGYAIAAAEGSESPVTEGGSYSFTVTANNGFNGPSAVKANGVELTAQNGVYTIENITNDQVVTVEGVAVKPNMYTVTASADVTATKGENAVVSILVTGNSSEEITGYNDYDVTVSYDPAVLTYVSAAAAHDTAEITQDAQAGTVRIVGHGDAKSWSDALASLTFTAVESGSHQVRITTAKIDNSGNAISLDAPEAAVEDETTLVVVAYPVTLPENFQGDATVLPGGDYSFTAPNAYYEITVTVDGEKVSAEVDGLVYTLHGVNGAVVVTAEGKTYDVNKEGTNVTVNGADTAQYGSDYTFTLSASSGYAVTAVKVTVNGVEVDCTISGGTYTVPGSAITGELTVTVTTTQQAANTTQITFEGVDASEVVGGLIQYATNGQDFTFELNEEEGYAYTVMLGDQELEAEDGVYTIPGSMIDGSALAITISKEVYSFEPVVNVSQYIQLNGTVMWLITATDEDDNMLAYGEEGTMFWSDKYNAYCWLVVSAESEDTVKQTAESIIAIAPDGAVSKGVMYDCDVNQSGVVDINDAQLTYDMYQARKYDGFGVVSMDRFLEADVNGDGVVNVEDARAVVTEVLN